MGGFTTYGIAIRVGEFDWAEWRVRFGTVGGERGAGMSEGGRQFRTTRLIWGVWGVWGFQQFRGGSAIGNRPPTTVSVTKDGGSGEVVGDREVGLEEQEELEELEGNLSRLFLVELEELEGNRNSRESRAGRKGRKSRKSWKS